MFCNICGHSCEIDSFCGKKINRGLIKTTVSGGYDSTPGNGRGALDDCTTYEFSICEFCLDFLFENSVIKPKVYDTFDGTEVEFKPAVQRVSNENWRKMKKEFFQEASNRSYSRRLKGQI